MVIPPNPSQPEHHEAGAFTARATRRPASGPTRDLHCAIPADLHKWLRREAAERETTIAQLVIKAVESFRSSQQDLDWGRR